MNKQTFTRDFKIGFVAAVAIFILYFGLNFLKGIDIFSSVNHYHGTYNNLGGLVTSAPVYIKGLKVGQVDEIRYDFTMEPAFTVGISVERKIVLPHGTQMMMGDDGLMGGKCIQLILPENGTATTGVYANYDQLESGVQSGLLDQLTTELLPKINSAVYRVDSLLGSVQRIVDSEELANSLVSIERTTSDLANSSNSLKQFMANDVPALADNLQVITDDFAEVGSNLKDIDFEAMALSAENTLQNLEVLSAKVNDKEGTLGMLLNDNNLYLNLQNTVTSADKLLIDLKEHPRRYVHFSLFGRKDEK